MTRTARGRGHAAAGAGVPGLVLPALVLATAAACGPPPGQQLCEAIAKKDLPTVHAVLEANQLDLLKNQQGCSPVQAAFARTSPDDPKLTEIGLELLRAGLPPQAAWDGEGGRVPAVVAAASNGNVELVRGLLAVGLRIEDPDAVRALHAAATAGHVKVVRLLVQEGIDPEVELAGRTALAAAQAEDREEVIKFYEELAARKAEEAARAAIVAEVAARAAATRPPD